MSFNEMFSFRVDVVDVNRKGIMIVGIVFAHALEAVAYVCSWDAPATP